MTERLPRPAPVSFATWAIIVGAVGVVLAVYDQISGINSLETRERVETLLSAGPLSGLGLTVGQTLDLMRVLAVVAGCAAAATAVLGWHVRQRSTVARTLLTLLAVVIFVAAMESASIFAGLIVAGVVLLWVQPARAWFAGVAAAGRPAPEPGARPAALPTPWERPRADSVSTRPATAGSDVAVRRPSSVTWAAVLTWVFSAVTAVGFVFVLAQAYSDPASIRDELIKQNPSVMKDIDLTDGLIHAALVMAGVVVGIWVVGAAVMAVLLWLRVAWARTVLLVMVIVTAAFLLFSALTNVFVGIPLVAAAITIRMLLHPATRAWGRRR